MSTLSETSGMALNAPIFELQGLVPEEEDKEKGPEKIFEEIIVKNFLNMGKKIVTQVQKMQSPIQDKSKEENTETNSNQTDKN